MGVVSEVVFEALVEQALEAAVEEEEDAMETENHSRLVSRWRAFLDVSDDLDAALIVLAAVVVVLVTVLVFLVAAEVPQLVVVVFVCFYDFSLPILHQKSFLTQQGDTESHAMPRH